MVHKTIYSKAKFEQHEPHQKRGLNPEAQEGY